ncbi:hypothetical protein PG989_001058 [Apiospora arundinis]
MLALGTFCTSLSVTQLSHKGGRDAQGRHGDHKGHAGHLGPADDGDGLHQRRRQGPALAALGEEGDEREAEDGEVRRNVGHGRGGDRVDVVHRRAEVALDVPVAADRVASGRQQGDVEAEGGEGEDAAADEDGADPPADRAEDAGEEGEEGEIGGPQQM